jgi:hypothetical protein
MAQQRVNLALQHPNQQHHPHQPGFGPYFQRDPYSLALHPHTIRVMVNLSQTKDITSEPCCKSEHRPWPELAPPYATIDARKCTFHGY